MNFKRLAPLLLVVCLAACSAFGVSSSAPSPVLTGERSSSATRYKLFIAQDGWYRVTAADLRNTGLDLSSLHLYRGEREIPLHLTGDAENPSFEFFARASDAEFSPFAIYWLTAQPTPGKRMQEIASTLARQPKESFAGTVRLARPTLYLPQFGEPGAPWFWQAVAAPTTTTITVTLPSAIAAPAQVRVDLWGSTQDPVDPDHHLRVWFNDARIADQSWDGQGARVITATIPANAVRAGVNTLRLVAPGDTRAQADIVLLRSIQVSYAQRFVAQDDKLEFEGGAGTYRIEGFSSDAIDVYDITDPFVPMRVSNPTIASRTITFSTDSTTTRRWLVVGPNARKSVARIAPMTTLDLRSSNLQADYVIVTHPDFVAALEPLVQWRTTHGLAVRVVTTDQVYDEFGYGEESPHAIRAFLNWTQQHWKSPAPRFALLVGKASYDYRNYLNAPNKNLLPTFLVETPNLRQAASDNWFVASSEKEVSPQLAIGRIPAKTPDQVARAVSKIIAFESMSADWKRRAIFVADDKESSFVTMADGLATQLSVGMPAQKIYLAEYKGEVKSARAEIVKAWNAGALLLTYIGHGSIDTWAEGPLFSVENLGEIKNGDRLPILITPTCLDGYFYHPHKDSLTEELLFKNDGGIVAGVVPTGLSLPYAQSELMNALFSEMFENSAPTLGEALWRAKQKISVESPEVREVIETFGLLGDPALAMKK